MMFRRVPFGAWPLLALWLLGAVLCVWIYQPGLGGPVLLDDAANLAVVQSLREGDGFAVDVIQENLSGPLGRPVSMASFLLDLYFLDLGVSGAKSVNLLLHVLVGSLLLLFASELFRALGVRQAGVAGLGVALLWLLAPLLLSTVLYMVQRMAQLATLFSLLSLWAYLRWRRPGSVLELRSGWLILCLLGIPLAALSKENGLLVLPLLVLLELAVLQPRDTGNQDAAVIRLGRVHWVLLLGGVLVVSGFLLLNPDWLGSGFAARPFSLWERLLTEGRILWIYVLHLLWPDNASLGIYHDAFPLSRGLLEPASSLYALLAWLLATGLALWSLRKPALRGVGFGLLFFLVGHAMESSIIPLELYFEHRNYLPAAGLYISLVALALALVARWSYLSNWLLALWALLLGQATLTTSIEAQVWSSDRLFHLAAYSRHPDSIRATEGLAMSLAGLGEPRLALEYAQTATHSEGEDSFRSRLREAFIYCRSGQAIAEETLALWQMSRADFADDLVTENSYVLVRKLIDGRCPGTDLTALATLWGRQILTVDAHQVAPKLFLALALLENYLERYQLALGYVDALLLRTPGDSRALMMRLYFSTALQLNETRAATLVELRALETAGALNRQERYNLELLAAERED